ncbi:MAG: YafY family transcriptional regulator [Chloroflexi bacterium]|nr:YafY family transcriptional regulator [Chloroflexota bacterium]
MYSPTMRLLTVLELLQSYEEMSGPELARRLEVDVRTVRRYILTLQDMGIPVEAERGPGGAYRLERGRRLPPLLYSDAEAVAITLGLLGIREFHFPVDVAAVEGALAKTERVLPENLLHQVRSLQEAITFNFSRYGSPPPAILDSDFIVTLSSAVHQRQRVYMRYRSFSGEESQRDYDPYGIVFNEGYWYTAGFCHTRQDLRTFRVDRMLALELIDEHFERPADFDVLNHVLTSVAFIPGAQAVEVVLKTSIERAREHIPPIMGTLEESGEDVIFRRTASQLDWIAHVLLGADFPVFVKQPDELRDLLREMAAKALQMAGG